MNRRTASHRLVAAGLLLLTSLVAWATPGRLAAQAAPIASLVIDADSGIVLHASNANRRVRPASLNKLMTALLVMQYLAEGERVPARGWPVSIRAAAQPATRLGLRSGRQIAPDTVLDALLVASANDAAVVAAEALAGDELTFARRMNETAARLGLSRTRFANASGLPATQFTTARDIAVLARYLWRTFPGQRQRFSQPGMTHAGRWVGATNPLLGSYRGARGMKTGFTCRAGFHLVGAAERGGRTLIAVVLGATARDKRSRGIHKLLDDAFARRSAPSAFDVIALADVKGQGEDLPVSTSIIANTCLMVKGPSGWNIDIGVHRSAKEARKAARTFIRARRKLLRGAREFSMPRFSRANLHRAIVTGLDQQSARKACLDYRKQQRSCIIFGPDVASAQVEETARIRALAAAYRAAAPKTGSSKRRSD